MLVAAEGGPERKLGSVKLNLLPLAAGYFKALTWWPDGKALVLVNQGMYGKHCHDPDIPAQVTPVITACAAAVLIHSGPVQKCRSIHVKAKSSSCATSAV